MNNIIKFSHDYEKLPENAHGKEAELLLAEEIRLEDQTEAFLKYDTRTDASDDAEENEKYYKLPNKGEFILLVFCCNGTIFTTLRRSTPQKLGYYKSQVGDFFKIQISEE